MIPKDFNKDCYETPQGLFDILDKEFNFIIDACSDEGNSKCENRLEDAKAEWFHQVTDIFHECELFTTTDYRVPDNIDDLFDEYSIFMNPPYSNPGPFLERAWEFSKYMPVVCLVRDDPSTKWYKSLVFKDESSTHTFYPESVTHVELVKSMLEDNNLVVVRLPKRLKFEINGEPQGTYNFPCCLMIMDRR